MNLLTLASLRHLGRHRAQCLLAVTGIALGVAIVVGMQVAQQSARAAFAAALENVFGHATHQLLHADGTFDERHLAAVRRLAPGASPTPVLEGSVQVTRDGGPESVRLVGVDVLSAQGRGAIPGFSPRALLTESDTVLAGAALAARWGLAHGDSLRIETSDGPRRLRLIGVLGRGDAAAAAEVLVADIATAQEVLGLPGLLSRIDLDCRAARACTVLADTSALPGSLRREATGARLKSSVELTRAFYTNLDALSLLALLVGAFMVYNTMAFLVLQRQSFFARLRALGVTRAAIVRLVALEAALLGLVGGVAGVALGQAMATQLLGPVAQTMRDHYFDSAGAAVRFSPWLALAAVLVALVVSLGAALVPALAAARAEPAAAGRPSWQQAESRRRLAFAARLGLLAAGLGVVLLLVSSRSLALGFAALGLFVAAAMLAAPRLVEALLGVAARRPHGTLAQRIALRSAARAMGRIGMAVAALMAATATSVGVGLMVGSFRLSVTDWLEQLLRADFYITQVSDSLTRPTLTPALVADLSALPEVAALSLIRRAQAIDGSGAPVQINAYALPAPARRGFAFVDGTVADSLWQDWETQDLAIVSQPYAWRHRLRRGDTVTLAAPDGPLRLRIAGIYRDYGSERGVVAISLARYHAHWNDERVHGAGVYPRAGADIAALSAGMAARLPAGSGLAIWPNGALRQRSLEVFDRTFAVTDVLTLFSTVVAALGVFNALLALHLERSREYAVMIALGAGGALLRRVLYTQTLCIGLVAALLALPLGVLIAVVLIDVINIRSFGWSMTLALTPRALLLPAAGAVVAALAAAVYPVERALQIDPAEALRHE